MPDTAINIKCPILKGITFAEFEPTAVWMSYANEEDVAAVCKNIDKKHEYELRLQYTEINQFPKELDGMSGELMIDIFRQEFEIPESFKPFIEKIMIDMTCSIWK